MSKKKLNPEQLKIKLSIRLNSDLFKIVEENQPNKSKYLEWLVYQDLLKNNKIPNNFIL